MTHDPALQPDASRSPLTVVFVIYPDISLLDLAGPLQTITWAKEHGTDRLGYQTSIVSLAGGQVPSDTLIAVDTQPMAAWHGTHIDTLIVVGGDGVYAAIKDRAFLNAVSELAANSGRVCSVCSGALVLAALGVLDGRRAVTHWEDADKLAAMFPDVLLEEDPIYIRDDHIWTSAGVTAGTDMALAIVAQDLGREAALARAQALVTYMVRPGGQSQFSRILERQTLETSARFERLHRWIEANLRQDLRVEELAGFENMSVRSFYRLYTDTVGRTPAKAVEMIRMDAAREMLETTGTGIKSVALRCGFGDEERMRRAFVRHLGVAPSDYRKRFRLAEGVD